MVLRMAKGEHVRTFWPLMLQCGSEDGDNYSAGFEKLHAELIEWGIPSPSQVHLDWFSSSKKAAQRVWPRAVVCRSIQHLRRNLLRNHRKGRRPPHPRKKKTKDHADSRRNRRNCSQPRLGEKKPKLAPHLKERSIFAFFDLFNRLMLVPSLSMHHLLLEIVLRRISNVWGDTSWVQYFEEQYCSKKRVDAELYGVDQAGCCCCCCHFFFTFSHCDRRKFTSQTSDNMDRWKSTARKKLRERESQKREDQRGRKSEEGRSRCAKRKESRETQCFPIVRVSGGSKSRLANAPGAEAAGQRRDENLHPLWREAHFQVYSVENCRVRTAFGRCDVETVRAVVARSTLPSQNVQSTQGSANR